MEIPFLDLVSIGWAFVFTGTRVGTEIERLGTAVQTSRLDSRETSEEDTGNTKTGQGFGDGIEEECSEQEVDLAKPESTEEMGLDRVILKEESGRKENHTSEEKKKVGEEEGDSTLETRKLGKTDSSKIQ